MAKTIERIIDTLFDKEKLKIILLSLFGLKQIMKKKAEIVYGLRLLGRKNRKNDKDKK